MESSSHKPIFRSIQLNLPQLFIDSIYSEIFSKFLNKISEANEQGCWLWIGDTFKFGYGRVRLFNKIRFSHRIALELFTGQSIGKLLVLHKCDNPRCVNPEHLYLGDHKQNTKDMIDRKRANLRFYPGDNHPCAKLTDAQMKFIYRLHHLRKWKIKTIAERFKVSPSHISKIVSMKDIRIQRLFKGGKSLAL